MLNQPAFFKVPSARLAGYLAEQVITQGKTFLRV